MNFDNLPNELKQMIFKKRYESMLYDKNKKQYDRVINEFNLIKNEIKKDYSNGSAYINSIGNIGQRRDICKSTFYDYADEDNWYIIESFWDWSLRNINIKMEKTCMKDLINWSYYQKLIWNDEGAYTKNIKIISYIMYICACDKEFTLEDKRKEIIKLKLNRGKFKKNGGFFNTINNPKIF